MADGLGLAASIIAVLQITTSVASLGYRYLHSAIRAPDSLRELTLEIQTLTGILSRLKICAQNPQAVDLRIVENSLHVCHKEMLGLQEKLKPRKGLLGRLRWPLDENDIRGYLGRIEGFKSSFSLALGTEQLARTNLVVGIVQKVEIGIGDISNTQNCQEEREKDQTRRDALNWLFPAPCDKRHMEVSSQRKKDTGQWIFKTQEVQDWIKGNSSCRLLWGYGIPGAGKTFLSSLMIDHIEATNSNYGVGYIYFNFQEQGQQTPIDTLSSLVKQLAFKAKVLPQAIEEAYKENKKPKLDQLYEILLEIRNSFAQTFIIFDALDECDQILQRERLLPMFHRLGEAGINLFLTSREHPEDIQESFANITKMRLWAKDEDISSYIEQRIADSPRAKRLINRGNSDLKGEIISALQECAKGMFLLVYFHIESLCQQTSLKQILMELEKIKSSSNENYPMDPTYRRAMENILRQQKSGVRLALRVISWLTKARRVLTVRELQLAVSVEEQNIIFDEDSLPDRKTLLDVCASLVNIDETSDCVRFVHYTAQEFLTRNQLVPDDADLQLAIACTTFLSYDIFSQTPLANGNALTSTYPLLTYMIDKLQYHLNQCDELLTEAVVCRLVEAKGNFRLYFCSYEASDDINADYQEFLDGLCELEFAACLENSSVVMRLLEHKKDAKLHYSKLNLSQSLMLAAYGELPGDGTDKPTAHKGNQAIIKLLLENGADPNYKHLVWKAPLYKAAGKGNETVVKLLLENGADPNYKSPTGKTPLCKATGKGNEIVVKLLLENGADPNYKSPTGKTPLYKATGKGNEIVVKLLLENGADPNYKSPTGKTPLCKATGKGNEIVVKLLLENGADPNYKSPTGKTSLYKAADKGNETVVKLLLENGADANAQERDGDTALLHAARGGKETIVKLLLENGADANAQSWDGETALVHAMHGGKEAIVKLFLENGIDANAQSWDGETALMHAARGGNETIVKLLLENGADANAQSWDGETALVHAMHGGKEAIVKLLLENGIDANAQSWDGETALRHAARGGNETIVKLLLANGADVNAQGRDGDTALSQAALWGNETIVKLLLENGADANANRDTDLTHAARGGNETIVKLFLENGTDANAQGRDGDTALMHAARGGKETIVKLLLANGADVNAQGRDGDTALSQAALGGEEAIFKLLLENGADANANRDTDLYHAARGGNETIVKLFLGNGAGVNAQGRDGDTALSQAALGGKETIVKLLLENDADANARPPNGDTALIHAARRGKEAIVKLLLENGADANAQSWDGDTVLVLAIHGDKEAIVKLLLENGTDANAQGRGGDTALSQAALWGNETIVKLLLENGADVNAQGRDGDTALSQAALWGNETIVKLLLENGADANANRDTDLTHAARGGNETIVKLFLRNGADVNAQDRDGDTALSQAALWGNETIVKLLLENGADANANRDTDLIHAARGGNETIVKLFLGNGADVNAQGRDGDTALSRAALGDKATIVKLLLENGADVNARYTDGHTVLCRAVHRGKEAMVKLHLMYSDPNAENRSGSTALHLATEECNEVMVKLLPEYHADSRAWIRRCAPYLARAWFNDHKEIIELLRNSIKTQAQQQEPKENDDAA
ncbi:ankyrin repeat-containing domain protein [Morchella snyderi]|nr:ankyrin repeat-containing domain protein [Morchella snyderi]